MYLTLQGQHEHDEEMGNLDRWGELGKLGNMEDDSYNHTPDDNVIYPEEFRVCEVRLVNELSQNRDQYAGEEFITLYDWLTIISLNIDRIRAFTQILDGNEQPGLFVAVSAAIHHGLRVVVRSEVSKKMLEVKKAIAIAQNKHPWVLEHLDDFFSKDPISLPNESGTGRRRKNVKIPRTLATILADLGRNMGCSRSNLALIAVMITLSEQRETIYQHAKIMSGTVDMFFKRLEFRTKVARLLLEM